jgi:hypothetical protein
MRIERASEKGRVPEGPRGRQLTGFVDGRSIVFHAYSVLLQRDGMIGRSASAKTGGTRIVRTLSSFAELEIVSVTFVDS